MHVSHIIVKVMKTSWCRSRDTNRTCEIRDIDFQNSCRVRKGGRVTTNQVLHPACTCINHVAGGGSPPLMTY